MSYAELTTIKSRIEYVREKLESNDQWILRALHAVFQRQTEDEKNAESTRYHNSVGFTGADGEILTSFAKQLIRKGYLATVEAKQPVSVRMYFSEKQEHILRRRIPKYARQLVKISMGNA